MDVRKAISTCFRYMYFKSGSIATSWTWFGARRACSQTLKFAADPNSDRFPAWEIAVVEAATLAPSNSTRKM
ncbi:hypothetical protein MTR_6g045477 [Medicago truncatula]|uniref:Uncharacterized protein n=1 Tax=Medicago truncatula TaxID=3880 RepID=A0A072U926_MEDTR|nr:hypothetical protein MTR_6g045477 [Medicago truncatula]